MTVYPAPWHTGLARAERERRWAEAERIAALNVYSDVGTPISAPDPNPQESPNGEEARR